MTDDTKKYTGHNTSTAGHMSPYPVSRLSPQIELVDLARQVAEADKNLSEHATGKLKVIAHQIRHLQEQAKNILEQVQQDQVLHRAECNFKKIPGKIYHLYETASGKHQFSMLSPEDWGNQCPNRFIGSYRLENDSSWTPAEEVDQVEPLLENLLDLRPDA